MGQAPIEYNDAVATEMMKLHCWSGSMWVIFPLDSLVGVNRYVAEVGERLTIDIRHLFEDEEIGQQISAVLESSKRK
jgi:hypothetical protein